MEVILSKAFHLFKSDHPDVKICKRSFESLRPKYIRLRRYTQRLVCCCTYHTNMDYIRQAVNMLSRRNGKPCPFPTNEALVSVSVCNPKSTKCIYRTCHKCQNFPNVDKLMIPLLKCSKTCFQNNEDCSSHTIKVRQFDRVTYMYKGKEKKKLSFVDNFLHPAN
jgi:hypothetical protein